MKKQLAIFLALTTFLFLTPIGALPRVPLSQVANTNVTFAFDFYAELAKLKTKNNFVFSPYALSNAMAIAYLASAEETNTLIAESLYFPLPPNYLGESFKRFNNDLKTDSALGLAIAMWVQKGLVNPDFVELVNKYYEGTFQEGDFDIRIDSTRNEINSWVAKTTNKAFPFFLSVSDVPPSLRMLLLATITLQASWDIPFKIKETQTENFFFDQNNQRKVPMMKATGVYPFFEDDDLKVIQIPYAQPEGPLTRLGFWIVLPKKVDGLKQIELSLNQSRFNDWKTKAVRKNVRLKIPRFRMNDILRAEDVFQKMGLKNPFSREANFSVMTDKTISINKIFQKISFSINEMGTIAKVGTPLIPSPPRLPPDEAPSETLEFYADRPFLFFVLDDATNTLLFLGRLTQP